MYFSVMMLLKFVGWPLFVNGASNPKFSESVPQIRKMTCFGD